MITQDLDIPLLSRALKLGEQVGHTPLVRMKNLEPRKAVQLWAKQEWKQLSGSVKCRPAYQIILSAIKSGALNEHNILLDATSGNTGIAYAAIGRVLGIRITLCVPENASKERKEILQSLGADIIYTSRFEGTDGAQHLARELAEKYPQKYFYADQYRNENNWKAHYLTTAQEIFSDLPELTHFVCGLGTTGSFVGTGRKLKELKPSVQLVSLQPDSALHGLEGWKHLETAIVPGIYDASLADETMEVSTEESYEMMQRAAREEGVLLSPSSAANLAGALKLSERIDNGIIVTILPDNADKYSEVIKKIIP
ncbi:MAG: PLP-dependent cysteine synthase family protein [Flavisolibacter sp.]